MALFKSSFFVYNKNTSVLFYRFVFCALLLNKIYIYMVKN